MRVRLDSSWTDQGVAILERACEAHGGWEGWRSLRNISFVLERLEGALPAIKGVGSTFPLPARIEVWPHEQRARFAGYPDADHVGWFDTVDVRIERAAGDRVTAESRDHRATFRGFARNRRWSPLDALYFFGYALCHYHSLPFTLAEGRLVRASVVGRRDQPLHALEIELPPDVPTHCRRQTFYFDGRGRLTRHDYTADIVGSWARGAHHWTDYTIIDDFPIALRRRVVPRIGQQTLPGTVLLGTLADPRVERN
jgi:hypothetical protein